MLAKSSPEVVSAWLAAFGRAVETNHQPVATRFVRLGSKTLRLQVCDAALLPQIDRQLAWSVMSAQTKWDATLIVWQDSQIERHVTAFAADNHALQAALREEADAAKVDCANLVIMSDTPVNGHPVAFIRPTDGFLEVIDPSTNTYYYGIRDTAPEEVIRDGHLFIQFINRIVSSPTANLTHGACVGLNGSGVLLCGIGHRGKSTLTVLSLIRGFEYVSDDYQIIERHDGQLFAYPVYSIITLSPTMYNEMYDDFKGKFVSMNGRKDKYVFNIAAYHGQFRDRYPIRACLFPEIVSDPEPSIVPCTPQDKSRAIAQLVGSTVRQMRDSHDPRTVKKLSDMIRGRPFYRINLCRDIERNVACLREFLTAFNAN